MVCIRFRVLGSFVFLLHLFVIDFLGSVPVWGVEGCCGGVGVLHCCGDGVACAVLVVGVVG